jgi:hypothetical protein
MAYESLMNEVECINSAWGMVGMLEALQYIERNEDEYVGTQVFREYRAFMREGARLFAPVGESA